MHMNKRQIILTLLALCAGLCVGLLIGATGLPDPASVSMGEPKPVVLSEESLSTVELVDRVSPAVVSIIERQVLATTKKRLGPFGLIQVPGDDVLRQTGSGSGFVISANGTILTNRHVVDREGATYAVIFSDGSEYEAEVLAIDPLNDIALLHVEGDDLPFIALGDSEQIRIGQTVIAIGNALGQYQNSVTKGIVSGVDRRVIARDGMQSGTIDSAIQTDAAINSGNSGGPLLDDFGRVIGINTAVSRAGQSIGFAIPINTAKAVVESYDKHGRIVRPWLGVRYVMLNTEFAQRYDFDVERGALIVPGTLEDPGIIKDSPADKAGLKERDVIVRIDGNELTQEHTLADAVRGKQVGDTILVDVLRDEEEIVLTIELAELPSDFIQ